MSVPHGHWKTTTVIAGLRNSGIVAPFVIDCPVNRAVFEAWVEHGLVPILRPGDVVVMNNLSSQKGAKVRKLIEASGAELRPCRLTVRTSSPSRTRSARSRPCRTKRPRVPSTAFELQSGASKTSSHQPNAQTCSQPQAMIQTDRLLL